MKNRKSKTALVVILAVAALCAVTAPTFCNIFGQMTLKEAQAGIGAVRAQNLTLAQALDQAGVDNPGLTDEQRWDILGKTLASLKELSEKNDKDLQVMKETIGKAEDRSWYNKMLGIESLSYLRIIAVLLFVIAIVFPVTLWLLSSKRLIGLSGLSSEVASTLVLVEERQAKLANILKEIQGEVDYLHTMSAPDLKNLIQQAEAYLKQNEQDLKSSGVKK
jgi:sensor histidine kinase YesM